MSNLRRSMVLSFFFFFFNANMFVLSYAPPGSLSWHSLVPVVVYSDWTMWLPCGCQAAPLLCGNWCLWYCRVAAVLWVTDLATCPALAAIMVRRRRRRRGGGGTGLVGGVGSTCHVGRGALRWNMWRPITRQIQQDQGDGICLPFTFSGCKC